MSEKEFPHFVESFETDEDGAWIYLIRGYQFDGQHAIHEDTMETAKKKLSMVDECDCSDCTPDESESIAEAEGEKP